MHHDSVHRDLIIRAQEVVRRGQAIVQRQEALIVRLRAEGKEADRAEAVLDIYKQTLQVFQQTYGIIASKRKVSESHMETLQQLMNRFLRQ